MNFKKGDIIVSLGVESLPGMHPAEIEYMLERLPRGLVTEVIASDYQAYTPCLKGLRGKVALLKDEYKMIRHATTQEEFLYHIKFREPFILEE